MPAPQPIPALKLCRLDFREGCYQINFRPNASLVSFEGTLRVDRSAPDGGADNLIASGDLYTIRPVIGPITPVPPVSPVSPSDADDDDGAPIPSAPMSVAGALSAVDGPLVPLPIRRPMIPIFPRSRYHSYLKVTSVTAPVAVSPLVKCELTERHRRSRQPGSSRAPFRACPRAPSR